MWKILENTIGKEGLLETFMTLEMCSATFALHCTWQLIMFGSGYRAGIIHSFTKKFFHLNKYLR